MDVVTTFAILICVLLLVVGGFLIYVYRWLLTRPVPDIQGAIELDCLDETVSVKRDRHGVPHITASSEADLFRAQGYIHAQDRIWQMEQIRRTARGLLSEIFGEAALPADRFIRTIGLWRSAKEEFETLYEEELRVLEWYCQGVNEYIQGRKGRLAAEFSLLRYIPEPWSPVDTLALAKFVGWSMSLNWERELFRHLLVQRLGPQAAAEMEVISGESHQAILHELPQGEEQAALIGAEALLREMERVRSYVPQIQAGQGSNCWSVSGRLTESGRPLLCNDPHLQISMPCALYEQHLTCPEFEAAGAIFPGSPGIIFGHNEHLAWGITNACTDVQDLYMEKVHSEDADLVAGGDGWESLTIRREIVPVKGRTQPVPLTVRESRHGPLISDLVPELQGAPLSLRWAGRDAGHTIKCILSLLKATDCAEGEAAFLEWNTPTLNLSFADTSGDISFALTGRHPKRRAGFGLTPSPGWTEDAEWQGFVPGEELPRIRNPESGLIVHANNRTEALPEGRWFGADFDPGYRAGRILGRLHELREPSVSEMERLQQDVFSGLARELVPEIVRYEFGDPLERQALQELADWDYRLNPESKASTIYHYVSCQLMEIVLSERLGDLYERFMGYSFSPLAVDSGFRLGALGFILKLLQTESSSHWYGTDEDGAARNREQLVRCAVNLAMQRVRAERGVASRKWEWGRIHQIRFVHLMGSVFILKPLLNRGPFPLGGDSSTPMMAASPMDSPGGLVCVAPAYRAVMDVGNWDAMESVIPTGQSGHPVSRMYDDQIGMWREGAYHSMPFSSEAVDEAARFVLELQPKGKANA